MLKKLIKYDFRSTWREFAAIYLSIMLGVTIFPFLAKNISSNVINMFMGVTAFAIIVAMIVVTIGSLFKIFNKNIFSNEGYLTMTLPASETQIVLSKLIVSSLWIILTGAVSTLGLFIFASIMSPESMSEMFRAIGQILSALDGQGVLAIVLTIVFIVVAIIKEVAKLFLACCIAHLKQLNRFRKPIGIISYFVFSWLETVLMDLVNWDANFTVNGSECVTLECGIENMQASIGSFISMAEIGIAFQLGFTLLFGVGTVFLLKRKLNLD